MAGPGAVSGPGGSATPPPAKTAEAARIRQAASDFEAVLIGQMLQAARRSPLARGPLLGGNDIYRGMMDDEVAKAMARGGGLGLADIIVRHVSGPAAQKKVSSPHGPGPMGGTINAEK
jgi:peptidoglycan hydrolase FlgJ